MQNLSVSSSPKVARVLGVRKAGEYDVKKTLSIRSQHGDNQSLLGGDSALSPTEGAPRDADDWALQGARARRTRSSVPAPALLTTGSSPQPIFAEYSNPPALLDPNRYAVRYAMLYGLAALVVLMLVIRFMNPSPRAAIALPPPPPAVSLAADTAWSPDGLKPKALRKGGARPPPSAPPTRLAGRL